MFAGFIQIFLLLIKMFQPLLVGGFNPSEKNESMGRIIPYIMENKSHVWNHQTDYFWGHTL